MHELCTEQFNKQNTIAIIGGVIRMGNEGRGYIKQQATLLIETIMICSQTKQVLVIVARPFN